MKRLLDNPQPSSGEQYYREDVLLSPREFPLPEGERAWRVACSGALTAVVAGRYVVIRCCGVWWWWVGGWKKRSSSS